MLGERKGRKSTNAEAKIQNAAAKIKEANDRLEETQQEAEDQGVNLPPSIRVDPKALHKSMKRTVLQHSWPVI